MLTRRPLYAALLGALCSFLLVEIRVEASSPIRRELATLTAIQVNVVVNLQPLGIIGEDREILKSSLAEGARRALQEQGVSIEDDADAKLYFFIRAVREGSLDLAAVLVEARLVDRVLLRREIPGEQELATAIWQHESLKVVSLEEASDQVTSSVNTLSRILASQIDSARREYP